MDEDSPSQLDLEMRIVVADRVFRVIHVWRQDKAEGVMGCTAFEVFGGNKAFVRSWDDGGVDWGWALHDSAEIVWADGEHDFALARIKYGPHHDRKGRFNLDAIKQEP